MIDLLFLLADTSLRGTALILAILLARLLLRKASKQARCLLWTVAGLRLLCPFTIQSPISLMPKTAYGREGLNDFLSSALRNGAAEGLSAGGAELGRPLNLMFLEASEPGRAEILYIPAAIWLLGTAALLCFGAVSAAKLAAKIRKGEPCGGNIIVCKDIPSPFVFGFIRPKICLPSNLAGAALEDVLLHERAHIQRGDHLWKLAGFIALAFHWVNPAVWLAYGVFCRDLELACDEKAVSGLSQEGRARYSQTLLNCCKAQKRLGTAPLSFGEVAIKERVRNILEYKKSAKWLGFAALAICLVLAFCFMTKPVSAQDDPKAGDADKPQSSLSGIAGDASGESETQTGLSSNWAWPVESEVISNTFGEHSSPATGKSYFCDHINISAEKGREVFAAFAGTVEKAEFASGKGYYVVILHDQDPARLGEIRTEYWHLAELKVSEGDRVEQRGIIGTAGATGMATGPNLGFMVLQDGEAADPLSYY